MSRYESASHAFYLCQYHIVWTPKYRLKILPTEGRAGNSAATVGYMKVFKEVSPASPLT